MYVGEITIQLGGIVSALSSPRGTPRGRHACRVNCAGVDVCLRILRVPLVFWTATALVMMGKRSLGWNQSRTLAKHKDVNQQIPIVSQAIILRSEARIITAI